MPTLAHKIRLEPTSDQIQSVKHRRDLPDWSGTGRWRNGTGNMTRGRNPKPVL